MTARLTLGTALLLTFTACGGSTVAPTPPPPPPPPSCQVNNTAELTFGNFSLRGATQDWWLDGSKRATLVPRQSITLTVAANIQHRVEVAPTNTSVLVCRGNPILTTCGSQSVSC